MTIDIQNLQGQLANALSRIERLEDRFGSQDESVAPWRYLVHRLHCWRRQLNVKGRNLTVGQLVTTMRANRLTPEQASEDLGLPLEAIQEAIAYEKQQRALLEMEAQEERRRLAERGYSLEPQP